MTESLQVERLVNGRDWRPLERELDERPRVKRRVLERADHSSRPSSADARGSSHTPTGRRQTLLLHALRQDTDRSVVTETKAML